MPRPLTPLDLEYAYVRGFDDGMRAGEKSATLRAEIERLRVSNARDAAEAIAAKAVKEGQ